MWNILEINTYKQTKTYSEESVMELVNKDDVDEEDNEDDGDDGNRWQRIKNTKVEEETAKGNI